LAGKVKRSDRREEAGARPPANKRVQQMPRIGSASYRVELPMMVLTIGKNHQAAVTIQAGEIFEVVGPAQDDRFVVIDFKGEQFLVFGCDLKDRGRRSSDGWTPDAAPAAAGG